MKKFIQIALMSMFSLFASLSSAGVLDDVGPSIPSASDTTTTQPTSAASAPEAAKPVAVIDMTKLLHCAKNYGKVAVEEQPMHGQYQYQLSQGGFSTVLTAPMLRHAVQQSSCFLAAAPREASMARWSLKVTVQTVSAVASQRQMVGASSSSNPLTWFIPGAAARMATEAKKEQEAARAAAQKPLTLNVTGIQVVFTLVDLNTGDIIASVLGKGSSADVTLGTALLSNAPGALSGDVGQNTTAQLVASAYADAMNQLVPYMDKLNASDPAK